MAAWRCARRQLLRLLGQRALAQGQQQGWWTGNKLCVTSLWWLLWAQADYELNPYRRRGGEERVPTPASSVVGHTCLSFFA